MDASRQSRQSSVEASVTGISGFIGAAPAVLRLGLGIELRQRRESAGVSRDDAAHAIRASVAKISRMESGRVSLKQRDIIDLLTLYRVADAERATFIELAHEASRPAWWHPYSDLLPSWFENYLGLEQAASVIRTYDLVYVPSLLQTPDYARAVMQLAPGRQTRSQIERRVELRMRRQQLLTRPDPPRLWVVIDENALHRLVGGRDVARAQIAQLLELNQLRNVTLQITPQFFTGHPALGAPFTLLRFAPFGMPDIVYQEHLTGAVYIDKVSDVDRYQLVMDKMITRLDPPASTASTLKRIHDEM